jgi:hypothetical protein
VRSFFADCLQKLFFMGLTYYQIAYLLNSRKIYLYMLVMLITIIILYFTKIKFNFFGIFQCKAIPRKTYSKVTVINRC